MNNIYVCDYGNSRIQKFDSTGTYLSQWGSSGSADGQFSTPLDLAIDSLNNIYVADMRNYRVQKFDSSGYFLAKWGSLGFGDGEFSFTGGIDVDDNNNVYVSDLLGDRIQVFDSVGTFLGLWGGIGNGLGQFRWPRGIALDSNGGIYIADSSNNRIQKFKAVTLTENPKAIVVAGGKAFAGNDLWDATQASTNFAYRALTFPGFTKDSIYYISSDTDLDLDGNGLPDDVDSDGTNAGLQYALEVWATDQLNGFPTGDVVLYLCDHGGDETFRMSGTETLDAATLDGWLDTLEAGIDGQLIVVNDACESGTFQDVLASSGRTVITSTSPGESAYFLSTETVSFSNFFWTQIFNGEDLADGYNFASTAVAQAFGAQNPLVNFDGDSNMNEATGDFDALVGVHIGSGTDFYQGRPTITSVSSPQSISGTSTATLSATNVTDPESDNIVRVWAVVRPPDFVITDSENPIQDLPSVDLSRIGATDNFTIDFDGFTSVGLYQITVYAMDSNLNVSSPSATTVGWILH